MTSLALVPTAATPTGSVAPLPAITGYKLGMWCAPRAAMEVDWTVVRALRGGTSAMRSLGTIFLPMDWRERKDAASYRDRLLRTFLLPAYKDAITQLSARPFQRRVTLEGQEKLTGKLAPLAKIEHNADRKGMSLTRFAQQFLDMAIDKGIAHILVDSPQVHLPVLDEGGKPIFDVLDGGKQVPQLRTMTAAEELEYDVRPYFCLVNAENLVNWAWRTDPGGREVLAFIAIYEARDATDTRTGDQRSVERIRYWSETEWQIWERQAQTPPLQTQQVDVDVSLLQLALQAGTRSRSDEKRPYIMVASGKHALGCVPLVSMNLHPFGNDPLQARPLLIELAWKNVEHWQATSNRNSNLHFAGSPIFTAAGCDPLTVNEGVKVGPGATVLSTNTDFKTWYTEPSGAALTALKAKLDELREEMAWLAEEPLMAPKTGSEKQTATAAGINEIQQQSKLLAAVEATEWAIFAAYSMAARWLGVEGLADEVADFDLSIFRDFSLMAKAVNDIEQLLVARKQGDISRETFVTALNDREIVDVDVQEELQRIKDEQQASLDQQIALAAGTPGGGAGGPDGGDAASGVGGGGAGMGGAGGAGGAARRRRPAGGAARGGGSSSKGTPPARV